MSGPVAIFRFVQECEGLMPDFAMFDLLVDLPGHPRHSTVSEATLRKLGVAIPAMPADAVAHLRASAAKFAEACAA
jgi:hypothetical protein